MPSKYTSPYATSFNSAVKRGTSWNVAVHNIAKRTNTSTSTIWNSLWKAGLCHRQKFNGQWVYWPTQGHKTNATTWKNSQFQMWQWFCEWCICNGWTTPENMKKHCGSQQEFMTWCRKFFGKQFGWTNTTTKSKPKRKASTTRKPKRKTTTTSKSRKPKRKASTTRKSTKSKTRRTTKSRSTSYKFPTSKGRKTTRRYRRAA